MKYVCAFSFVSFLSDTGTGKHSRAKSKTNNRPAKKMLQGRKAGYLGEVLFLFSICNYNMMFIVCLSLRLFVSDFDFLRADAPILAASSVCAFLFFCPCAIRMAASFSS